MKNEEKLLKTTAIPNAFLNDCNLSAGAKIIYILLMKYERFEKNNSGSFFTWSKDYIKRDTAKKYINELLSKEYIDENNNFYYFDNGEKKDYNGQSFSATFKTISFFPVKEELLFAKHNNRSLTPEQKLFLIFFDRDRSDTRKGWHPHFITYEKYGLKKDAIKKIIKTLKEKNIINYEVRYFGKENKCLKQTFISKIKIAYLEDINEIKSNTVPVAECVERPVLRTQIEEDFLAIGNMYNLANIEAVNKEEASSYFDKNEDSKKNLANLINY